MMTQDDFSAFLSTLTPEQQQQFMALGTLDERDAQLQEQMALAQALGQPSERQYVTPLGAGLGELANGLKGIQAQRQLEKLQADRTALLNQKDAGRNEYLKALKAYGQLAPTYDVVPAAPFSFGG